MLKQTPLSAQAKLEASDLPLSQFLEVQLQLPLNQTIFNFALAVVARRSNIAPAI
jgi:hypothetical protein